MTRQRHSPPDRLETTRLYLRSYQTGDGPVFFAAGRANRAHLARFEARNVILIPGSVEEAEQVITGMRREWETGAAYFWGVFSRETGGLVGQVYVGKVDAGLPEFAIGYFVDWRYEGQGIIHEASEAVLGWIFDSLDAHRVRLECSDANPRSLHVAERLGFRKEAHFRKNRRETDGSFTGTLVYAMLREDYRRES
jgi:RimJ/RimL family protein N-acetyltransferase